MFITLIKMIDIVVFTETIVEIRQSSQAEHFRLRIIIQMQFTFDAVDSES